MLNKRKIFLKMRRVAALCACTAALLSPAGALYSNAAAQISDGMIVELNKSTIIRLPDNADVVAIADPAIADVDVLAPNLVSIQGRGVGQTTVVAFNSRGDEILNQTITVNHNLSKLAQIVSRVMPDTNITFDSMDGALIMSGDVESPLEADNIRRIVEPFLGDDTLVSMLNVKGSDQVMLKVRIAEVSRTELKRFGINLSSVLTNSGNFAFGLVTGRDIGAADVANIMRGDGNNNLAVNFANGNLNINSVIDALAQDNLIKVLAEPNLTTASGRSSSFLAGGEYPIPVPGQDGQVTIEYREYGVGLEFSPQVLSKDKISLTVAPEVSELSQIGAVDLQGFSIPALTTRRAETTVELGSGQSFAIAGLLRNGHSNNVEKFPFLGDLPILGALFRSTEFQQEQTELVIIITPYIVRGASASELTDPTVGYVAPTDPERILLGHTYTPKPEPKPVMLEGSPSDLRNPRFRRSMANQASGVVVDREEIMTPAPSVAKTTPANKAAPVENVEVIETPVTNTAPAPATKPEAAATLNGPVGFMLR
ncbi:MAG: type II and III secretion system protein family protein [Alphaproteobacteria bacterium]|nr:type II and III secretion system protein family protein [Alphaproteobacteria bacterium]